MVKPIGQILIITWNDGHITKKRVSGWSEMADVRERYASNSKVRDTELQYDIC